MTSTFLNYNVMFKKILLSFPAYRQAGFTVLSGAAEPAGAGLLHFAAAGGFLGLANSPMVPPPGFEPGTLCLRGRYSTNWVMGGLFLCAPSRNRTYISGLEGWRSVHWAMGARPSLPIVRLNLLYSKTENPSWQPKSCQATWLWHRNGLLLSSQK